MQSDKTDKKLAIIVSLFIVMTISMVLLSFYSNRTLTGARGYIAGEGLWAKAQKNAILELIFYAETKDDRHYDTFHNHLDVIIGDREGRDAMLAEDPDFQLGYDGFKRGGLNHNEIGPMLWLLERFHSHAILQEAIEYWKAGDDKMDELRLLAGEMHELIQQETFTNEQFHRMMTELYFLDEELTILENNFSHTVREAADQVGNLTRNLTLFIMISLFGAGGYISVKYFRESGRLNRKLAAAEFKFRNVLEKSQDIIYQMDAAGTHYEYISPSVEKITGYSISELMKEGPGFISEKIHPDDRDQINKELTKFKQSSPGEVASNHSEFRLMTKQGKYIWASNNRSLIRNHNGDPIAVVGNVRDISDKVQYLEKINKSLKEKETLLSEIHHRVKNNLAIISSLIELQRDDTIESPDEMLNDLRTRIQSIALVHEKLYQSESFSEILLSDYIEDLTIIISEAYGLRNKNITVDYDIDPVKVDIAKAIPLGLLFNELINNVYKHAFQGRKQGKILIKLKHSGNGIELSVADDGVGLPEDFSIDNNSTLGMTLIRTLGAQLKGQLDFRSDAGTTSRFVFKG